MSLLSNAICFLRFAIFWTAYVPSRLTAAFARPFAAHCATLSFFAWTVSWTSGVWPFFVRAPVTVFVEIPLRKSFTFALQWAATPRSTCWVWTMVPTADGLVFADCSRTELLAEYGCPR